MPQPYSLDLRERVVAAAAQQTQAQVAARFAVGESTVYKWCRRARETGSAAPRPHTGGGHPKIDAAGGAVLTARHNLPSADFEKLINLELGRARCVVVLWSRMSVESSWVRRESRKAKRAKKLIPIMIDEGVTPPTGFKRLNYAQLFRWTRLDKSPEFKPVIAAVRAFVPPAWAPGADALDALPAGVKLKILTLRKWPRNDWDCDPTGDAFGKSPRSARGRLLEVWS